MNVSQKGLCHLSCLTFGRLFPHSIDNRGCFLPHRINIVQKQRNIGIGEGDIVPECVFSVQPSGQVSKGRKERRMRLEREE